MQRVKNRSFEKFGERALPGGDLYEREQSFYELIQSRKETLVSEWAEAAKIPIIHLNGEKTINENLDFLLELTLVPLETGRMRIPCKWGTEPNGCSSYYSE